MQPMSRSAVDAYAQVAVDVGVAAADPHKLVLMLFDGAIKAVYSAKVHMQGNDVALKGRFISHAVAIIDEGLKPSLDENAGGDIARNLKDLYEYMCHRLIVANLKNQVDALDEVGGLLGELRSAWEAIGKQAQSAVVSASEQQPPQQRAGISYGKV